MTDYKIEVHHSCRAHMMDKPAQEEKFTADGAWDTSETAKDILDRHCTTLGLNRDEVCGYVFDGSNDWRCIGKYFPRIITD